MSSASGTGRRPRRLMRSWSFMAILSVADDRGRYRCQI